MRYCFILQGASGSGKSSVAKVLCVGIGNCEICSTDSYHYIDGKYEFRGDKLGEFHKKNQERAKELMATGFSVVIDNTNIRKWEARPYVEAAIACGLQVVFIRCEGQFANIHGVPAENVEKMRASMEELTVTGCLAAPYPWDAALTIEVPSI